MLLSKYDLFAPIGKSVKGMVQEFSTRTRSRSCRNVADTKLERSSLSADVSLWFSTRKSCTMLFRSIKTAEQTGVEK